MDSREEQEYESLLTLENLESLHEELEELGLTGTEPGSQIPEDLHARMVQLGVRDIQQIHERITRLHAQLDEDDSELTITDS